MKVLENMLLVAFKMVSSSHVKISPYGRNDIGFGVSLWVEVGWGTPQPTSTSRYAINCHSDPEVSGEESIMTRSTRH